MQTAAIAQTVTLENEHLQVRLLPGLGAKIQSLKDKRRNREWLLGSQRPGGGYAEPAYGADFSQFDTSGFDECFPNVAEGPHPDGGIVWPDHGELWSRPWAVDAGGAAATATISGQAWPYTFTRRAALEGETLRLDYALENHAERPFRHLWSAHPLLRVSPGMKLLLPEACRRAYVQGVSDPALGGHGAFRPWPELAPGRNLATVPAPEAGVAAKLFFPDVAEGRATLLDPVSGECLTFAWDPAQLPHLGLWLCYGGWPDDGRPGHLTVAIEPCTGMPDSLQEAAEGGRCPELAPGGRSTWSLTIRSHHRWQPTDPSGARL